MPNATNQQENGLSQNELKARKFILSHFTRYGREPSVREVGEAIGLAQPNNANKIINRLVHAGEFEVESTPGRRRMLRLPAGKSPASDHAIPLRGPASCGAGVELAADPEEWLDVAALFKRDDLVAYEAVGNSMIDAGILHGDYIVVREQPEPRSGQTVVAMFDRSMVCKVFRRGRGKAIRLESCNDSMGIQPIVIEDPAKVYFRVLGVLSGVVRRVKS